MSYKTILRNLMVFLLLGTTCCQEKKGLEVELDSYVKTFVDKDSFNGSILVAKDGKILLCKGYGMANYEYGIPNTSQTNFRLGSITKTFTAMAIM